MGKKQVKTRKSKSSILPTLRKVKKKVIYGAKVGKAGLGIYNDVHNPYKMGKVVYGAVRGKGVVYPGSKYIGPGNPLDLGTPLNSADAAAKLHDEDYQRLLKKGVKPSKLYFGFSEADKRLIKRSDITTKHGLVTFGGMSVKRGLYKLGLTGSLIKD